MDALARLILFTVAALVFLLGPSLPNAIAQAAPLPMTNAKLDFITIQSSGASSRHQLNFNVAASGVITGRGKRFDFTADSSSARPAAGSPVTVLSRGGSKNSRLGTPTLSTNVFTESYYSGSRNTNVAVSAAFPVKIFLSDGAVLHGTIYRGVAKMLSSGPQMSYATTNMWAKGVATYQRGFSGELEWTLPTNLSFSNPFGKD